MVKCRGPLHSFGGQGALAGTLIFQNTPRGTNLRKLTPPTQPRTLAQRPNRAITKWLSQYWATIPTVWRQTWSNHPSTPKINPYHCYLKYNLTRWQDFKPPSIIYPATESGTGGTHTFLSTTVLGRTIQLNLSITYLGTALYSLIFQGDSSGFSSAYNNLVALHTFAGAGTYTVELGPFDPGTYWFRARAGTRFGKLLAETNSLSALVP